MFSYEPLWQTTKEKGINKKTDLIDIVNISPTTLSKLSKNENVSMDTLGKLCESLDCNISCVIKYKNLINNECENITTKITLNTVSLFSGIGGFEEGINKSNIKGNIVFSSEIDRFASKSYLANFPNGNLHGDITMIDAEEIPEHDFLVAGFPCQAFSIAGKREGFENKAKGTLFFDIIRVLKSKRPKYILLENVKNLISHDRSRTIQVILDSLVELGYTLDFTVLNSSEAGVPQNRDRTYIVGILDYDREKYHHDYRNMKINKLKNKLNKLEFNSFNFFNTLKFDNKQKYLEDILEEQVEDKYYFNSNEVQNYLSNISPIEYDNQTRLLKHFDLPKDVINDNERQRRVYSIKGLSPTLLARSDTTKILLKENGIYKIRKLNPIESLRVQGFDDKFIENIKLTNVSDTQLYKQAGNAVSPPAITGIINHLITFIEKGSVANE